jgi:mRNA interferase MazF
MATTPARGDVWLVDLGLVAKVRPCVVLSTPADDPNDRVLTTIVPHTTATRNSRFEVRSKVRFLKPGAFDAQNIITIPTVWRIARGDRVIRNVRRQVWRESRRSRHQLPKRRLRHRIAPQAGRRSRAA